MTDILDRIAELKAEWAEATGDDPDDYVLSQDDWAFGLGEDGARELVDLIEGIEHVAIACEAPGTNHSDDLVKVYSGNTEPHYRCGYHAFANTTWKAEKR